MAPDTRGDRPPLSADARLRRRERARARRRARRRGLLLLIGLLAVVLGGTWAATGGGGGGSAAAGSRFAPGAAGAGTPGTRPVQIVVAASGDLLIHSPVWERAQADGGGSRYDFRPMFAQIRPYVQRADIPLCHVETPVTPAPPTGYPILGRPAGMWLSSVKPPRRPRQRGRGRIL